MISLVNEMKANSQMKRGRKKASYLKKLICTKYNLDICKQYIINFRKKHLLNTYISVGPKL